MAIPWKAIRSGFLDGFNAYIVMFGKVQVPGSLSDELNRLTTPKTLAEYRAVDPGIEEALLRLRDTELTRDRSYALVTRVLGCIEIAATIAAVCYLASHHRL